MSGLEPLRGLLQVVEAFIEDKRRGVDGGGAEASAAMSSTDGDLFGDLNSFLANASLEELLSLRKRICLGGLRSIDELLKAVEA